MSAKQPSLRTPGEILEAALGKEQQAFEFYSEMLNQSRVPMVSELLSDLMDEELKHVRMVEKMIARMNLG